MASIVPFFAFGFVIALMVWLLLDPSSLLNLMQSAIPPEGRNAPARHPYFAVIVMFGSGVGFCYELRRSGVLQPLHPKDALQFYSLVLATIFFAINAVGACYWPIAFQRVYNPRLRHVSDHDLPPKTKRLIEMTGKGWGVLLILTCSYLVYTLNSR
jgi:hypothetical protein